MAPHSSDADKELMEAALKQLDGKIDYQRLARDLGIDKTGTAWKRWSVFKKRLGAGSPTSPSVAKVMTRPAATPPKTPNGTARGKQGKGSKKRKWVSSDDEEDEVELQIEEDGDGGKNGPRIGSVPETPSRRLPARRARVTTFKEEPSETEDDEMGEDIDSGHGSGQGGTVETEGFSGASDEGEA